MEGDKSTKQYGISQRTIHKLFSMLEDKAQQQHTKNLTAEDDEAASSFEYSVEVGMLEIYNDEGENQAAVITLSDFGCSCCILTS
jgi:hypothetical protein